MIEESWSEGPAKRNWGIAILRINNKEVERRNKNTGLTGKELGA